ncbi:MAG: hypothetical protein QE487_13850 [Fluviicola sp.]|nr:hypothetical protein [Fluviicola sp.]
MNIPKTVFSQDEVEYEQFTINLNVDKLGVYEMEAIYYNDNIYLPIIDLFGKLEIYLNHSVQLDTINGFILSNDNSYSVNLNSGKITFRDKSQLLKPEQIISDFSDVYLPKEIYEGLFGMTMDFNFRELTLFLRSDIELPVIKQLRIKKLRTNLLTLTGDVDADTTIARKWNWIRGAVIDWNLQSKEVNLGANVQQFKSSFGMEVLGGELNWRSLVTRDSAVKFQNTSLKWRYVNDKFALLKQLEAGNINVSLTGQTISNFYGVKLTNTPYSIKKTFGSYLIQRKTNPGWDVEIYVNGILVNFTTADMNGYFNFEIPLVFGSSIILIRYYGPWGQESIEEIPINIPFSFTTHKHLEYQTHSGITADSSHFIFNKSKMSYGLSRWATISAGYEYFEGNMLNKHIFSGSLNLALGKNTLLNYTYLHNSSHYIELMQRTKRNLVITGKHRQYLKNQTIIQTLQLGESELGINVPIWNRKLKIHVRNTDRFTYSYERYSFISESAISFFYKRINTGFTLITSQETVMSWNTSFYFKNNWTIIHNTSYNISRKSPVSSTLQLQKRFNKMLYAETNFSYAYSTKSLQVGMSIYIDFNFMRTSGNMTVQKNYIASTQTVAGSVHFTGKPNPVFVSNSNSVGRAGLDVIVFLDVNHNDVKDDNEPFVKNATVAINKGKQVLTENDTIHRFVSLEPYTPYLLTVANNGFPSISWILEKSTWSVVTNPNQIKKVFIPVKPMGEVEMKISINKNGTISPANRQIVYIMDSNNKQVGKGLTEQDGYFSYLGLAPGNYTIQFDEKQLKGLGLSSNYPRISFEIKTSTQGDFVDGIEITLQN